MERIFLNSFQNFYIKKVSRKDNINRLNFRNFDILINTAADVYDESKMFKNNTLLVNNILSKIIKEKIEILN